MDIPAISKTDFAFPGQTGVYHGKVRDVYTIGGTKLLSIATDRVSAFDQVLPFAVPFKGQVLNQLAAYFLGKTADIVPNWLQAVPDRTDLIAVTTATSRVDHPAAPAPRTGAGCSEPWLIHEPVPDEIFDPSVALDQEPPGWIWLDGTLALQGDGSILLCDAQVAGTSASHYEH